MIIKKYRANTVEEARKLMEEELGEDAVILTTRQVKEKGIKGFLRNTIIELTAGTDQVPGEDKPSHEEIEPRKAHTPRAMNQEMNRTLQEFKATLAPSMEPSTGHSIEENGEDRLSISAQAIAKVRKMPTQKTASNIPSSTYSEIGSIAVLPQSKVEGKKKSPLAEPLSDLLDLSKRLVQDFKGGDKHVRGVLEQAIEERRRQRDQESMSVESIVREEMQKAQRSVGTDVNDESQSKTDLVHFLCSKGVSRPIALRVEASVIEKVGPPSESESPQEQALRFNAVRRSLENFISCTGPIQLIHRSPHVIALVGPTGVGKTSTAMKIAAQFAHKENKKVSIIAFNQSENSMVKSIFPTMRQYGVSVEAVETVEDCELAIMTNSDKDLIIIDTAGSNPCHFNAIEELNRNLQSFAPVDVYLTLSATTKDIDVFGMIKLFSPLNAAGLIFTKLDETIASGVLINASYKMKMPISYITQGQDLLDDLRTAAAYEISKNLMMSQNSESLREIRELACS